MAGRLLDESAKGVYIISATPFTDQGEIDFDSTDKLVDFYLESGVDGITILGVLGEAPKLSAEESTAFVKRVLKRVGGKVQIVVGVSSAGNLNPCGTCTVASCQGPAGVGVGRPCRHRFAGTGFACDFRGPCGPWGDDHVTDNRVWGPSSSSTSPGS